MGLGGFAFGAGAQNAARIKLACFVSGLGCDDEGVLAGADLGQTHIDDTLEHHFVKSFEHGGYEHADGR